MEKANISRAHKHLESLLKEQKEWVAYAQQVLNTWHKETDFLVTAIATGLKDAYERGAKGLPPPTAADAGDVAKPARARPAKPTISKNESKSPAIRRVRRST